MSADVSDAVLVARAQQGYLDAYSELVSRYGDLAYRVALKLLGNHHDAEDIAQEALVAAWQQLPQFKAKSSFSTWLYQIVRRRALNRLTRTKAVGAIDPDRADTGAGPAGLVERSETIDAVTDAVTALPAAQRVVVELHHFQGLSYADVARVTNSTTPAVRSHLHRARRSLTSSLGGWG